MDISILKSIATIAEKVAPTVAAILTGGSSTEITTVITLLSNLFGANPTDQQDLMQKITADADAQVKLKQIEMDYQSKIAETNEKDNESARQMPNAMGMREFLVVLLPIFITVDLVLCFIVKDHDIQHLFMVTFVTLIALLGKVYALYFGSGK